MRQTVCDKCETPIPGNSFHKHSVNNVQFQIPGYEDLCYYCACEIVYGTVTIWKAEYDASVEGTKRIQGGK